MKTDMISRLKIMLFLSFVACAYIYAENVAIDGFNTLLVYGKPVGNFNNPGDDSIVVSVKEANIHESVMAISIDVSNHTNSKWVYFGKMTNNELVLGHGGIKIWNMYDPENSFIYSVSPPQDGFVPIILDKYGLNSEIRSDEINFVVDLNYLSSSLKRSGSTIDLNKEVCIAPFISMFNIHNFLELDPEKGILSTEVDQFFALKEMRFELGLAAP